MSNLFKVLDQNKTGKINFKDLLVSLQKEGILHDDNRMQKVFADLGISKQYFPSQIELTETEFDALTKSHNFLAKALKKKMVIPNFQDFCEEIKALFHDVEKNTEGSVADYIPQLARVNPDQFAVSICTIDGQRFSLGNFEVPFCLQSSSKPINYCLALEEHGLDKVHHHVGREPSGVSFNALALNTMGLPHNPMINAGAIMSCSLLKLNDAEASSADRFAYVLDTWKRLCAQKYVGFDNTVYLSERKTADRNFALAYFMRENDAFPDNINLIDVLELYFQCCSIQTSSHNLVMAPATLANAGMNPLTGDQVFKATTVRDCMSLMTTCGMYNWSGEFAFKIGLPAKSGISGVIQVVVPNTMGIVIWSPRLDKLGNSVRGIEFCERLIEKYNFHNFDSIARNTSKKDPRKRKNEATIEKLISMIYAASNGDLEEIHRLKMNGMDLNLANYDGRTAIHLAASENQLETLQYLIDEGVDLEPKDRWGGTPLDDAKRHEHEEAVLLLENALKQK